MSDKLSDESLPCPFCGCTDISEGEVLTDNPDGGASTQSMCRGCGALGPDAHLREGEVDFGSVKSTAAWNRRASPEPAIPAVDPVAIIEQCAVLAATHSQYPVETDFDHGYAKARRDAAHSIRALKAASAISESEDALLTAARRAIPALAHAAERNPAYQRDYEELSKAIEDAARKGGGS